MRKTYMLLFVSLLFIIDYSNGHISESKEPINEVKDIIVYPQETSVVGDVDVVELEVVEENNNP